MLLWFSEKLKTTDKVLSVAVGCLKSGLDAKIKLIQDYWGKNGKKASNQNWQNQIEEINKNFGKGSKKGLGVFFIFYLIYAFWIV